MFCIKCGTQYADGAAFCSKCGYALKQQNFYNAQATAPVTPAAPVTPVATPAAPVTPVAAPAAPVTAPNPGNGFGAGVAPNPVIRAVKSVAGSPVFLTAVIAFSLQILFNIINSFGYGKALGSIYRLLGTIEQYVGSYYIPYEVYDALDALNSVSIVPLIIGKIISLIPTILICIGLWLVFASAANKHSDSMSTSGLTLLKVMQIISLVGVCLSALLVAIVLILMIVAFASYEVTEGIVIVCVLFLIFAIGFFFSILYATKIVKSLSVAKKSILSRAYSGKASVFVAVMCYIGAAGCLFSIISNPLINLMSIVYYVCFGIAIAKYNNAMTAVSHSGRML